MKRITSYLVMTISDLPGLDSGHWTSHRTRKDADNLMFLLGPHGHLYRRTVTITDDGVDQGEHRVRRETLRRIEP